MSLSAGYVYCGCRDCFEITIGAPGTLCSECVEAGCDPDKECSAPGAYGGIGGYAHTKDADCTLDADDTCTSCGVYHGSPCETCKGAGFHTPDCKEVSHA